MEYVIKMSRLVAIEEVFFCVGIFMFSFFLFFFSCKPSKTKKKKISLYVLNCNDTFQFLIYMIQRLIPFRDLPLCHAAFILV